MRRYNLTLMILFSSLFIVFGCTKESDSDKFNTSDEIQFSCTSGQNTKTAYSTTDPWQINWIPGDQISIFCMEAYPKDVVAYDVTPNTTDPTKGTIMRASFEGDVGIRWNPNIIKGKTSEGHNIYAIYPSIQKSTKQVNGKQFAYVRQWDANQSDGRFILHFPETQYCSKIGVNKDPNNRYMLKPNMDFAYMTAKPHKSVFKEDGQITNLVFYPVSTTLEITVKGKDAIDIMEGVDITSVEVKGINISVRITDPNFKHDVYNDKDNHTFFVILDAKNEGFLNRKSGDPLWYDLSYEYCTHVVISTYISDDNDNRSSIILGKDESITFTTFIPPIKYLDNVEVSVIAAGTSGSNTKKIIDNSAAKIVYHGDKRRVTLPNVVKYPFSKEIHDALVNGEYTSTDTTLKTIEQKKIQPILVNGSAIIDLSSESVANRIKTITSINIDLSNKTNNNVSLRGLETDYFNNIKRVAFNLTKERTLCNNVKSIDLNSVIPDNRKTQIDGLSFNEFNELNSITGMKSLPNLKLFVIDGNNSKILTNIDFSSNPNLEDIRIRAFEKITSINLTNLSNLKRLSLDLKHSIASLDLSPCNTLRYLSVDGEYATNKTLKTLNLNTISTLDSVRISRCNELSAQQVRQLETKSPNLSYLHISLMNNADNNNNLSNGINVNVFTKLKDLNLSSTSLNALDISKLSLLEKFDCSNNNIPNLSFTSNPNLLDIKCINNELEALDISPCLNLTSLLCYNDESRAYNPYKKRIKNINLGANTALTNLECFNNELATLDLAKIPNLTGLTCDGNDLTVLDISQCPKLKHLTCCDNKISVLKTESCPDLHEFQCAFNNISSIDIRPVTNLRVLQFTGRIGGIGHCFTGGFLCDPQGTIGNKASWKKINLKMTQSQYNSSLRFGSRVFSEWGCLNNYNRDLDIDASSPYTFVLDETKWVNRQVVP